MKDFDRVNFILAIQAADSLLQLANRTRLTFEEIRQRIVTLRREGYNLGAGWVNEAVPPAKMVPVNWWAGLKPGEDPAAHGRIG